MLCMNSNNYINEMQQQKIIALIVVLLTVAICQKQVTVTCTTCAVSSCAIGFCITMTGSGYNETVCPSRACTSLNTPVVFNVNNCTLDYAGVACSTGLCYYLAGRQLALLNQDTNQCVNNQVRSYTCGNCIAVSGCASNLCIEYKISDVRQVYSCTPSCPVPTSTQFTVSTCTEDVLFTSANCCMNFNQTFGAGGVCSTQSTIITSSKSLRPWVKGTTFEYTLTTFLLFALVTLFNFMM